MMPEGVSQSKPMQIPKHWPLVNNLNSRDGLFLKDARLVNCFAEKDVTTGLYKVIKRPGIGPTLFNPDNRNSPGQGMFVWNVLRLGGPLTPGFNYNISVVAGSNLYNYSQLFNTFTLIGSVAAIQGTKVSWLQVPNATTPRILISGTSLFNGNCGYYMGTDYILHIIPQYPSNTVPGLAYLDGTIYVMDVFGAIWNTLNPNDPTIWDPLGKINAISEADYGVVLGKQLTYIVAVKQWTTLFFFDNGNTVGSPLAPVAGATLNVGCLSADTFQQLENTLFWVTQSQGQPSRVCAVHDLQLSIISTPAVDRLLDLSAVNTFYSLVFMRGGHEFYLLSNVTKNVTMIYDIREKLWYLWTDTNGNFFPMISQSVDPTGRWLMQRGDTAEIVQCDSDYIYPNDTVNNIPTLIPVDIYTPNFDAGADRTKFLSQMRFMCDQTPGSVLYVRYSDDDYQTWNNFRKVDLSSVRPMLGDEGSFYRRAYHFRHLANTPLRIDSVELQMDLGTL